MATSSGTDSGDSEHPSWFTPKRLLVMFCIINMLNYVDRGVIASNGVNGSLQTCTQSGVCTGGSGIQGDFNLSYFEDGILSSAFMVGLLLACPIFASLAKSYNPFRLIGVGLSVWTFATAGCGASFDFWSIAIFRMLVGVGEASFISLAAPFIDDNAPKSQKLKTVISEIGSSKELHTVSRGDYPIYSFDVMKTAWLSLFYMCIPTGIAVGYVYGGVVGGNFNWRFAFFGEAILMLPFAVLGFVMQPLQMKGLASDESKTTLSSVEVVAPALEDGGAADLDHYSTKKSYSSRGSLDFLNQLSKFWIDMKLLLSEKVYVVNVLGYIAYNFVIGAYSYWGPKAGYEIYHMSNADLLFGGVTIVCGIFGTVAGGYILDYMGATISNAFKLLSGATFLGAIFCFSAFCSKNLYGFIFLFSIGELLVFATQGPVNWVCLHSVNSNLRPLSMAMSTVSIHIFGDVPSSPLVGVLQDYINNWRETSLILTTVFFVAAGIWFIGSFLHSVDKFVEDGEHETEPLLEGDTRGTVYGSDKSVTIPIS